MKASWLKRLSVARTKKSEFLVGALVLAGLLAVLVIGAFQLEPLAALERQIDDVATAHFTPAADGPHPDVAVVAIDDATIAAHPPRSPINRNLLARLIEILEAGNPRAIGIDILLTHPTDEAADRRLAQALRASEVPVVVATALDEGQPQPLAQAFDDPRVEPAVANLPIDRSREIVREFRTDFEDSQGRLHATLSKRLAEIAGGTEIPDAKTPRPIDWYGRPGLAAAGGDGREQPAIATFPAHVFLDVPSATALLEGKVVLIGATFEGAADRVKTPFTRLTADARGLAGVQVHAQLVGRALDRFSRHLKAPAIGDHDRARLDAAGGLDRGLSVATQPGIRACSRAAACARFWSGRGGVFRVSGTASRPAATPGPQRPGEACAAGRHRAHGFRPRLNPAGRRIADSLRPVYRYSWLHPLCRTASGG